jgi:TBC1 domain family member 13
MENNTETYFNINEYVILDNYQGLQQENKFENKKNNSLESSKSEYNIFHNEPPLIKIDSTFFYINNSHYYINDEIFGPILLKLNENKMSCSERVRKKITDIISCLISSNKIDLKNLRILMFEGGIPDEFPGVRALIWKLMLKYFPLKITEWKEFLQERRLDYENIKMDYLLDYENDKVYLEIIKDIKRTRTHMHFFTYINQNSKKENNSDILSRILFIFAKLHPDISYIQGMNEILATIFFCFAKDPNPFFNKLENLEADVFYCFENLILEIKDIFQREKDETEFGIHKRIDKISDMLNKLDLELFSYFQEEKVELHYFVFRWYTLLFTQEFCMPDTLRLWDSIVIQVDKLEFVSYLCLAIILKFTKDLQTKDFSGIMFTMQNLTQQDISIDKLIYFAEDIKTKLMYK